MMKRNIALAITLALPLNLWGYGTFFGTKAMAMGGAFSAVADDPTAVWYNPASLPSLSPSLYLGAFYLSSPGLLEIIMPVLSATYGGFGVLASIYPSYPEISFLRLGYGKKIGRMEYGGLWLGDIYAGGGAGLTLLSPTLFGGLYVRRWPGYSLYLGIHEITFSADSGIIHNYRLGLAVVPMYGDIHRLQISGEMWLERGKSTLSRYFYAIWSVGASYTFYKTIGVHIGILEDPAGERVGPTFGASLHYEGFTLSIENEGQANPLTQGTPPGYPPSYALRFSLAYTKRH